MHASRPAFSTLRASLPFLCILICALQPLLDVLSYWQMQMDSNSAFTLILRIAMIAGMLLLALLFVRRRGLTALLFGAVLLYLIGHVLACLQVSSAYDWKEDLADQARMLMLPATAFCFTVYLQANSKVLPALKTGCMLAFALIVSVMLLSVLSGTDPHTYAAKGIGIRGWFFWTSAQSAILSLLSPLAVSWALKHFRGRLFPLALVCLLSFGSLFAFGTRLAYASLAATGLGLAGCILFSEKKHWPQALTVFFCTAVFLALYPVAPMTRNQSALRANETIKQAISDRAAADAAAQCGLDPADLDSLSDPRVLAAAYRYNLQGMMDRFGIERVAAAYDNSLDVLQIWNERIRKLRFCQLLREDALAITPLAGLFGLEIGTTRVEETAVYVFETASWEMQSEASDPENDFYGIFYLCGLVGLGMMLLFLGYYVWLSLKTLWLLPKQFFAPAHAAFMIAFGIALVYGWNTVSVLRRNNASFFFALVLACVGHLCQTQLADVKKKEPRA